MIHAFDGLHQTVSVILYDSYSMTHANKLLQQIICRTLPYSIKLNYDNELGYFNATSTKTYHHSL